MEQSKMVATKRTRLGSKHTRRLRQTGQIPAIIYGHGQNPLSISLNAHDLEIALHHHVRVLELDLEGAKEQYLIKAVQYDYLETTPIHLDLVRVDLNEKVQVTVEIELKGTPAGATEGGVLTQLLTSIDVECAVTAIPEELRPNVAHLGINDSLFVKDLELPKGVVPLNDLEEKVATCRLPSAAEEATEEEGEEGAAEPEMIGRSKEEEESA